MTEFNAGVDAFCQVTADCESAMTNLLNQLDGEAVTETESGGGDTHSGGVTLADTYQESRAIQRTMTAAQNCMNGLTNSDDGANSALKNR